jgi:hypothetical protein
MTFGDEAIIMPTLNKFHFSQMCTGSHPEKIVAFDVVPYKACQAKLFN